MSEGNQGHGITPEEAQAALNAERQERLRAFGAAVEAAGRQFGCGLEPVVTITPRGIEARVQIVALR